MFERMTPESAGLGIEKEIWAPVRVAFAKVTFGSSEERRKADAPEANQKATFRVLSSAVIRTVTTKDRIVFNGGNWGITGIALVARQAREIEFTAIRRN